MLPAILSTLGQTAAAAAPTVGATAATAAGVAQKGQGLAGLFGSEEEPEMERFIRSLNPGIRLSSRSPRIFGQSERGQRSPLRLTETNKGPDLSFLG